MTRLSVSLGVRHDLVTKQQKQILYMIKISYEVDLLMNIKYKSHTTYLLLNICHLGCGFSLCYKP